MVPYVLVMASPPNSKFKSVLLASCRSSRASYTPLTGMATGGLVPNAPGGVGCPTAEAAAKLDANDRKRSGEDTFEGDVERRVRPKVDLPLGSPEKALEEEDTESQEEVDTRLRALVEVASQRKGDVSVPSLAFCCRSSMSCQLLFLICC